MQINRISHIVLFSTSQEFFISENDAIGSLVITDIWGNNWPVPKYQSAL